MRGRSAASNCLRERADAVARDRSAGLAFRCLLERSRSRGSRLPRRLRPRVRDGGSPRRRRGRRLGVEVALGVDPIEGGLVSAVPLFEGEALAGDVGVEVVGRDELVLRPIDEADELVEPPVGIAPAAVIDERQVGRRSRRRRIWSIPSSTSGCGGRPASAADSVRMRWQKLWKLLTLRRPAVATPTIASRRSTSCFAALTL